MNTDSDELILIYVYKLYICLYCVNNCTAPTTVKDGVKTLGASLLGGWFTSLIIRDGLLLASFGHVDKWM